jgi:hypothetical protein
MMAPGRAERRKGTLNEFRRAAVIIDLTNDDSLDDGRSDRTLKSGSVSGTGMGMDFPSIGGPWC